MGIFKKVCKLFKCKSMCVFGEEEVKNLKKIDLSNYHLTIADYYALEKITRRPTIDKGLYRNSMLDITN